MSDHHAHHTKKHYRFASLKNGTSGTIRPGETGEEVRQIQTFLNQTGYLGGDQVPGMMCPCTCKALRYFQKCYGLEDSGMADRATMELMQRPRCGNPDVTGGASSSGPAPFVLRGCRYPANVLTYAFLNSTGDLPVARQQEIIREAFQVWAEVTPLQFTEVAAHENPTFPVAFHRGDHGDGSAFDDSGSLQGNTLAHAFYPPTCGGVHSGALHFDEFESWLDGADPGRGIRLLNVAIHEVGHLLGLGHSNLEDAIMFAFYDDAVDSLRADDIAGVQELYGTGPIRGDLHGTGDSKLHRLPVERGRVSVTLRGPENGADFDLYLRAGSPPNRSRFDARGFSPDSLESLALDVAPGELFILVDSWRGAGSYEVTTSFVAA